MKKILSLFFAASILMLPQISHAAFSQYNIYSSLEAAYLWMEENSPPLSSTDYAASDHYMMALSRIGYDYDYDAYISLADKRSPSTYTDEQRLIIATTACGSVWNGNAVREYSYKKLRDNARELAGSLITLDCGGYEIADDSEINRDHIIVTLLSMQLPDGSFDEDVYTTSRALTALAPYINKEFRLSTGEHKNAEYIYNTQTAVLNAISYLEKAKNGDFGYGTVTNTSNVIIALDSVGVNADADPAFSSGGASPVSWLKAQQQSNGSFNDSAYDTALAMCALTSHLRAMQGLSSFYDFTSDDKINIDAAESGDPHDLSGDSSKIEVKKIEQTDITPPADTEENSEYGPFPFVGPEMVNETPTEAAKNDISEPEPQRKRSGGAAILIIAAVLLAAACIAYVVTKKLQKKEEPTPEPEKKRTKPERDLIAEYESHENVVSEEELYSPDFIKSLYPVENTDSDETGSKVNTEEQEDIENTEK